MSASIDIARVSKTYHQGGRALRVLDDISLHVDSGEIVGLMGQSGAGKSTLLHIAGLLDRADAGEIRILGQSYAGRSERLRTEARLRHIGFIYQFHYLLPEFTALENVVLPMRIAGMAERAAQDKAAGLLDRLGLSERLTHRPAELSGGEQQRVAIARALANDPAILLADEPTGNLDESTAARVMDLLLDVARERGLAAILATHNRAMAERTDRMALLKGGRLDPQAPSGDAPPAA